tara:strand:- start:415 stop:666 length:252 start_codon:yes stop_codon:yes gene_type:complete
MVWSTRNYQIIYYPTICIRKHCVTESTFRQVKNVSGHELFQGFCYMFQSPSTGKHKLAHVGNIKQGCCGPAVIMFAKNPQGVP